MIFLPYFNIAEISLQLLLKVPRFFLNYPYRLGADARSQTEGQTRLPCKGFLIYCQNNAYKINIYK
jgi:hypothetical protein